LYKHTRIDTIIPINSSLHRLCSLLFFFTPPATTEIYTLSLHDALPIFRCRRGFRCGLPASSSRGVATLPGCGASCSGAGDDRCRSEEHTSELQSRFDLVCRLLLEKKKTRKNAANVFSMAVYARLARLKQ